MIEWELAKTKECFSLPTGRPVGIRQSHTVLFGAVLIMAAAADWIPVYVLPGHADRRNSKRSRLPRLLFHSPRSLDAAADSADALPPFWLLSIPAVLSHNAQFIYRYTQWNVSPNQKLVLLWLHWSIPYNMQKLNDCWKYSLNLFVFVIRNHILAENKKILRPINLKMFILNTPTIKHYYFGFLEMSNIFIGFGQNTKSALMNLKKSVPYLHFKIQQFLNTPAGGRYAWLICLLTNQLYFTSSCSHNLAIADIRGWVSKLIYYSPLTVLSFLS